MLDAVVIGAGQAGLATSYWLTQHGLSHVVLERGRVGDPGVPSGGTPSS